MYQKQYETEDWEFHSIGNSAIVIPFPNSFIRFMLFTYTLNKSYPFFVGTHIDSVRCLLFSLQTYCKYSKKCLYFISTQIWPHPVYSFYYILISSITQLFYLLKNSHFRSKTPPWILFVTVVFYLLVFIVKQVIEHRTLPLKQSQPAVYIP